MELQRFGRIGGASLTALALSMALSTSVVAQESDIETGGVDVQTFRPALSPGSMTVLEGSESAEHLQPYGSIFFDYLSNPLVLAFEDGTREPVIDNRVNAHMALGIGLWDRAQFEVGMPVVLLNDGSYEGQTITGGGPGDIQTRLKGSFLSSVDNAVGLGAVLDVTIPTGRSESYLGSGAVTAAPMLVADTRVDAGIGELLIATNFGARFRPTEEVHNIEIGPELKYGAGAQLAVVPDLLKLGLEFYGAVGLTGAGRAANPLEMLFSAELDVIDGLAVKAGVGAGLVSGIGSPQWRGLLGVVYRPDGLGTEPALAEPIDEPEEMADEVVECPPEPEGYIGPYDEDGCPITPENFTGCDSLFDDFAGAVDEWGCPMLDSDGDGMLVWDDECPTEPMVFIEGGMDDGCPDDDVDGDGIPNIEDHCPTEPGLSRYDGCPPPEDEETVTRTADEIKIEKRVHFETDKAIIKSESYDLLEEVALVIRTHQDILLVEIAGHTDQRGDADYNLMLSKERAQAVREFLIKRGNIPAARLDARGYGLTEPIVDGDSDEALAENRRVEFRIIETGEE